MASTFTRGNPIRGAVYDALCSWEERRGLLEWRRALVGDLTGDVAELGAGTGRNLPHYPAGARVTASDFDPVMLGRARRRAHEAAADVTLLVADAQALPFSDASIDVVVVGLVLCSVPHQERALREIRRVLRPGGRFRFLEHVRDADGTRRARIQDAVNPAWRFASGGCNCNRRTGDAIGAAGFEITKINEFQMGIPLLAPHVQGEAVAR